MERERLGDTLIGRSTTQHVTTLITMGKRRKQQQQTQLAVARLRGTTPAASQLQNKRQQSCRAAGHTLKLSVVFN